VSTVQFVADRLVVEPPWVEFSILRPFHRDDSFLRWEDLNSHPAHFTKVWAFLFNILVGPSKKFDNTSLLAVVVLRTLVDRFSLPDEVNGFKSNGPSLSGIIGSLN
jgi:hypothetical protein